MVQPQVKPSAPSLEDRALKYIETHNKHIWIAIAILAVVVVAFKRSQG
jgi:hypothetical protein